MSEWQPIETAPKDEIFLWGYWMLGDRNKMVFNIGVAYRDVSKAWPDPFLELAHDAMTKYATHWMPLPKPPKMDSMEAA